MRRAAASLGTAVILGATFLGCREGAKCDRCGTLVAVVPSEADMLVPAFTQAQLSHQIGDLLFLKLADLGLGLNTLGDSGFLPRLARGWKFEDSLTLVFDLDPRARWQDGPPVTAQDVAFTFAVYTDPKSAAPSRPLLSQIASVTARDARTAVFRFRRRYSEQFYDATHHMRILPQHLLDSVPRERLGAQPFNRNPVGDGPYRLVSWKPGESIELVEDTAFFLGRPGLSRIIFRVSPDPASAVTQLTSGEADFLEYLGGPENVARIAAAPSYRVVKYTSPNYIYLGFNLRDPADVSRPNPLFRDRELRRALSRLVDRQNIVSAVFGEYGKVALGPTSRMTAIGNDSTLPQLTFDTVAAAARLDSLGWRRGPDGIRSRNGRRLEFQILVPSSSQVRNRMAVILQDQFRRGGVNTTLSVVEFNLFNARTRTGKFDALLNSWSDDPPPSTIRETWTSGAVGNANAVGYANPDFDRLVNDAWLTSDPGAALAKWKAAIAVVNQDAPGIWLANPLQPSGIHRRYENVSIRTDEWTATLWTWRVSPGNTIERDHVAVPPTH